MPIDVRSLPWHDFLERPPLPHPSLSDLKFLRSSSILITGAGGSIGSALASAIAPLEPARLILLNHSELNLNRLVRELEAYFPPEKLVPILGSAGDESLLDDIFTAHTPHWAFHAAAHKHLALLETQPLAAIQNNALATWTLARKCRSHGCRLILVSTDKAAAPSSILGATKRLAEIITLTHGGAAVRFGNVLGSSGSAVEHFAHQLSMGAPITITDPSARRYFITLEEAANLLLATALELNRNNASGTTLLFAADLNTSQSIQSLAAFLALHIAPHSRIDQQHTSLHPGEKKFELLWSDSETPYSATRNGIVQLLTPLPPASQLAALLAQLQQAVTSRDASDAIRILRRLVPGYTPSELAVSHARTGSTGALIP